jgi:hypothetical protein
MPFRRTTFGIRGAHRDDVLVDVILMHVVKVTVVKVVHMAIVPDCGVAAIRTVLVSVVEMMLFGARHGGLSIADPSPLIESPFVHEMRE